MDRVDAACAATPPSQAVARRSPRRRDGWRLDAFVSWRATSPTVELLRAVDRHGAFARYEQVLRRGPCCASSTLARSRRRGSPSRRGSFAPATASSTRTCTSSPAPAAAGCRTGIGGKGERRQGGQARRRAHWASPPSGRRCSRRSAVGGGEKPFAEHVENRRADSSRAAAAVAAAAFTPPHGLDAHTSSRRRRRRPRWSTTCLAAAALLCLWSVEDRAAETPFAFGRRRCAHKYEIMSMPPAASSPCRTSATSSPAPRRGSSTARLHKM